jgi:hypothetical protein
MIEVNLLGAITATEVFLFAARFNLLVRSAG